MEKAMQQETRSDFLEGKVVVVTGAGNGIGRDFALQSAAAGARVVVNDIGTSLSGEGLDSGPAESVVQEIKDAGGEAAASTDSVATWDSAHKIVQCALDNFGRIDGVINNAGVLRDRFFFNMSEEEWRLVVDVHLNGSFFVSRAAAPHFKAQNGGSYVHVVSTSGLIGNIGQANYAAAKGGIASMSRGIAIDMQRYGVRSNCLAPFAWTRMVNSIPTDKPDMADKVEKAKRMESRKIAPLAVYLVSDAAQEVTGQVFAVRANELFLMSQSRPLRSVHRSDGWTPQAIAEHAVPAFSKDFYGLDRSADVFSWDPI